MDFTKDIYINKDKIYENSESEEDGIYQLFLKGVKDNNINLKNLIFFFY